jgi:hypothetical protein
VTDLVIRDGALLTAADRKAPMQHTCPSGSSGSAPVTMVVDNGTAARLIAVVGRKTLVGSVEVGAAATRAKVFVDSEGEVGETNEQDNSAECEVT